MRYVIGLSLFFYSGFAFTSPLLQTKKAFLEHKKQKQEFENKRKKTLKTRLSQLEKIRNQKVSSLKIKKEFLKHKKQKQEFENKRKKAFALYKKQLEAYQKKQKSILQVRLKQLQSFRKRPWKSLPPDIDP